MDGILIPQFCPIKFKVCYMTFEIVDFFLGHDVKNLKRSALNLDQLFLNNIVKLVFKLYTLFKI